MNDEEALSLLMNGAEAVCAGGVAWAKQASPELFADALAALRSGALRPRLQIEFSAPHIIRMLATSPDGGTEIEVFRYAVRALRPLDFN